MTGGSRAILRSAARVGNAYVRQVRILILTERFAMMGWGLEAFSPDIRKATQLLDLGLVASLVGHAFVAFHLGPALVAALASAGLPATQPAVENDGSDSESISSSIGSSVDGTYG